MSLPILHTTVVGSYSMPSWLERLKTEYFLRRISRHELDEIHDTATISGAFSPGGQVEFELYGPDDPSCSGAPRARRGTRSATSPRRSACTRI